MPGRRAGGDRVAERGNDDLSFGVHGRDLTSVLPAATCHERRGQQSEQNVDVDAKAHREDDRADESVRPAPARAPGSVRHAQAGGSAGGAKPPGDDRRRRPSLHRGARHVLPRDHRRGRDPPVLVQGRRSGFRPRARRADARVPELRRERDVPFAREPVRRSQRRPAVRRLRGPEAAAAERPRVDRRGRSAARRVRAGSVRRPRRRNARLPELPALHPQAGARRALPLVPRAGSSRRCRSGSGASGRSTSCLRAIPRATS